MTAQGPDGSGTRLDATSNSELLPADDSKRFRLGSEGQTTTQAVDVAVKQSNPPSQQPHVRGGRPSRNAKAPRKARAHTYKPRRGRNPAFDHPGQGQFQATFGPLAVPFQDEQQSVSRILDQAPAAAVQHQRAARAEDSRSDAAPSGVEALGVTYDLIAETAPSGSLSTNATVEQKIFHTAIYGESHMEGVNSAKTTHDVLFHGRKRADSAVEMAD